MPNYCVNIKAQPGSDDHEVHDLDSRQGCLPAPANRRALGFFADCRAAVRAARAWYDDVNGCARCCPACHTT